MEQWSSNNAFDMFYSMLREIQASSRRDPKAASMMVRNGEYLEKLLAPLQTLNIPFSGEEEFGRYLDLHELYNIFINSKFGFPLTYTKYLDKFPGVDDESMISAKYKGTQQYKDYVVGVLDYLVSFINRAEPLMFLDRLFKNLESEFEDRWRAARVGQKRPRATTSDVMEQLKEYNTLESLMELGLGRLKEVLDCLGLKSGGTLQQRAERVFLVKNTPLHKLHPTHLKKDKEDEGSNWCKATALMEAKVIKLCELLKDTLERTRQHVKNRQGMTAKEIAQDREANHDDHNLDGETEICNKFPLGRDGKPIPYWLYKPHGLNQEYKCEICGDSTYKGRRAFEKHFHQGRHQLGMRCLGIPNTSSFHGITSIEDAKRLWHHIRLTHESSQWKPDLYEEFEDSQGNIYFKKMYADLLNQGLI